MVMDTSAMLVGAGIRGGQVIGGYDDSLFGRPLDLQSGETTAHGVSLEGAHLGATLLALGGVDPGDEDVLAEPISAVLS